MNFWLCIASDYTEIHALLCDKTTILSHHCIDKKNGNQQLILTIDELLKSHETELSQMEFIGINVGPAPYTSLRIAIATVNGLHAATGIPLVMIDALRTLIFNHEPQEEHTVVALLNAFSSDVFYAVAQHKEPLKTGDQNIHTLLSELQESSVHKNISFIGNGAELYRDEIEQMFGKQSLSNPMPSYSSMQQMIDACWKSWQKNDVVNIALPLYLKQVSYKNSINVK